MNQDVPNPKNFCGGNFQDWLEVNLIESCNAHCHWCIEKDGYHPSYHAPVETIAKMAIETGKTNIILLGGEPLLYKDIKILIELLVKSNKKVWITTNGYLLTPKYWGENLLNITGVNISIHHYDLVKNKNITNVLINKNDLLSTIAYMHMRGTNIRMNCNAIKGYIDTPEEIISYVQWAKNIGADKVRFAELKQDDEEFVDLAKILNYKYGLNDNPFTHGCNSDCVIEGVPVNFRQMCGLQTSRRIAPLNPKQELKQVLYYDGKIYNGWQTIKKENEMNHTDLYEWIKTLTHGKLSEQENEDLCATFHLLLKSELEKLPEKEVKVIYESSGGCQY